MPYLFSIIFMGKNHLSCNMFYVQEPCIQYLLVTFLSTGTSYPVSTCSLQGFSTSFQGRGRMGNFAGRGIFLSDVLAI